MHTAPPPMPPSRASATPPPPRVIARRTSRRALAIVAAAQALLLATCSEPPAAPKHAGPGAAAGSHLAVASATPTFAQIGATGYQQTFDIMANVNDTTPPLSWTPSDWSIVRHSRDPQTWYQPEPMMAWHGSMCQKPDNPDPAQRTHPATTYADLLFQCRNHMMTAMNASGYGVIYMTPAQLLSFQNGGTAVVRFDVATLRATYRDWIDLWITPYAFNLVAPLDDSLPDLQGEPINAVHVRMTAGTGSSAFEASVVRGFVSTRLPVANTTSYETAFAQAGLVPSATRRDTFELHISRTYIQFGMPRYNLWWVDTPMPDLGWDLGIVQFGQHSFDPMRGCPTCGPNTWHWDNLGLDPVRPFTIINASSRYVDQSTPQGLVTFPTPAPAAPARTFLRFEGYGGLFQVSFNGRPWVPAVFQFQKHYSATRFLSYWTPVPPGTTSVRFRLVWQAPGLPTPPGVWMVRDLSLWSS